MLAESILRKDGAARFNAFSAGSHPKGAVNSFALKVLDAHGYPTDGFRSKSWNEFAAPGAPEWTSCSRSATAPPARHARFWPGQPMTAHWGIEDPAAVDGTDSTKTRAFNEAFRFMRAASRHSSRCR